MRRFIRKVWPGMLALVLSGSVFAHDPGGYHDGHGDGVWSGNATVWANSTGQSGYAGNFSYHVGYGYSPGYVPWLEPGRGHGPQCHHGPRYGYPRGHRHGYKHGRKHGRKHHGRHH